MNFEKSKQFQKKSHKAIPEGSHTYAKGDDQVQDDRVDPRGK